MIRPNDHSRCKNPPRMWMGLCCSNLRRSAWLEAMTNSRLVTCGSSDSTKLANNIEALRRGQGRGDLI